MYLIQNITSDAFQKQSVALPNGQRLQFTLYFSPMFLSWYFSNITYDNFTINNIRVFNSPNILQQWVNRLPFGIACSTVEGREPSLIEDFSSGSSKLYILDETDLREWIGYLSGS